MCGIVGYVGPRRADARQLLSRMADGLAHRGPDAQGYFLQGLADGDQEVGLGHRRLSIVDLSTGDQPLAIDGGRLQIVFNGEIYNHRSLRSRLEALGHCFSTASDTEVIVHAYDRWGADCVQHLRGMFAFALWDERQQTLFIARDRFGEKPLYWVQSGASFVFASELRALLCWPGLEARLNVDVLPHYLQYRYVPGPDTWLHGVRKLSPGCHLRWSSAGVQETRYYRPADSQARTRRGDHVDAPSAFAAKLEETVALMMQSDVPYGAFLSGGLDSSAIVAMMARHSSGPVRTFSIGFAEQGYSELAHAATVARCIGADHHEFVVSSADIVEALPQAARFRDGPLAEPADVPIHLLSRAARRSVKMVLTGEGSDEALGGYPKHVYERLAAPYSHMPRAVRRHVVEPMVGALPYRARRLQTAMAALSTDAFEERMPRWFGALSGEQVQALCGRRPQPLANGARYPFESDPSASSLRRMLYFDQTSWLPDNLLERGDRMTMAASLEARMPFMDHELIELAASFDDDQRVKGTLTKRVLRQAVAGVLPAHIIARRKFGFTMPIGLWLRTSMKAMLADHLQGANSLCRQLMDGRVIDRYVDEHQRGAHNHEKLLWMLLNFELWARQMPLTRA